MTGGSQGLVAAPMASSSSASACTRRNKVPLILCPSCENKTVVKRTSKTVSNLDRIFYTCPDHEKDGSGYNFWFWEEGYMKYLKKNGLIAGEEAADVNAQVAASLKNAGQLDETEVPREDDDELKQTLITAVSIGRELVVVLKNMLVLGWLGVAVLVCILVVLMMK
ncbi:Os02g0275500 [Oryza sativa Japonica Group]|uniref:GRF-type domain-containing protein n=3 Tax=Oryza sativa subsp. japonica TaxID=39947 RepID=A0A8J8YQE3_ORYSJ|nr:hypothetical protein OsJ_06231 [Oryza sativa Japonica Group]BAS78091.1 Os02g0275500 [Oryza sativa Japonica Group]